MSKLIQLRQRIRAIETIKKITHAMRLIAMSTHSQLKGMQDPISAYTTEINTILNELLAHTAESAHSVLQPNTESSKTLVIIIGSQKGLCGSFNTHLFKIVNQAMVARAYTKQTVDVIAVGQKAVDFAAHLPSSTIIKTYEKYNSADLSTIAHTLTNIIMNAEVPYKSVIIATNEFKSFFNQSPKIVDLIPFKVTPLTTLTVNQDLLWEQTPQEIATALVPQYLHAQINYHLFQSLYAEHAARFISMDAATRNAKTLLENAKLEYNKLRQAKITKELTELSGSYS